MKVYKKLTIISAVITIITLAIAVVLHYVFPSNDTDFWINICLGIFGGSILSTLSSIVSYNYEKIKTLESFRYHTQQIIYFLQKYQSDMSFDQKVKFFLDYNDFDKITWDSDYGNISFFFEFITKNRKYIYNNIYKPILDFNNAVATRVWFFRQYIDYNGENKSVMPEFVDELQVYLLDIEDRYTPTKYDDNGEAIAFSHLKFINSKLTLAIDTELAGHYYEILYGKRYYRKMEKKLKSEGQING